MKPKVISFDLDGTLVDKNFDDALWFQEIPKLYSEKHGVSFQEAWNHCTSCYDGLGDQDLRWYDIDYWLEKFEIGADSSRLIDDLSHTIKLFDDSVPVLEFLKNKGFKLVVISNANRKFLDVKMRAEGMNYFFSRVFSVTSDFQQVKKTKDVYLEICKQLGVKPEDLVHVGDHEDFDYLIPLEAGVQAFLLDRWGCHPQVSKDKIASLEEFAQLFR